MKRIAATVIIMFVFCLSFATAENWINLDDEFDCEGIPMVVSGRFLSAGSNETWCEYRTGKLTKDETATRYQEINWRVMDCNVDDAMILQNTPGTESICFSEGKPTDGYFGVTPFCGIDVLNFGSITRSPYTYILADRISTLDQRPLGGLTWVEIQEKTRDITNYLGVTIGEPVGMKRCDDYLAVGRASGEPIDQYWAKYFPSVKEDELEDVKTIEVFYPVYWNGKRLYSGENQAMPGESFILPCPFSLSMHHTGTIISMHCPYFSAWESMGNETQAISLEDAIECLQAIYADLYLPGVKQIVVSNGDLCYVPIAGDARATKGFHVYPCYVFFVTQINDDDSHYQCNVGIHAITGNQIF